MTVSVRPRSLGVAIVAALLIACALAPAAQATFPGSNGDIAFTSERNGNREIYTMGDDGSSQTRLTTLSADDRSPAWNSAGSQIAFASNRAANALADFEIYKMTATGSSVTLLASNLADDSQPAWAPSGTQLVIVRGNGGGETDLWILEADGSGAATDLTGSLTAVHDEVEPNWSPNGNRIAFAAYATGATQRDIYSIKPDGTDLVNLTNTPARDDREPNWSPDSTKIVYSSFLDSDYDIHTMNADGTGDLNRTNFPGANDREPVWSPDGTRIAFVSRRAFENEDIYVMLADGSSSGNLTSSAGPDTEPDWQRGEPDPPPPPAACEDGVDNDADTKIDYPADPGCLASSDTNEADNPPGLVRPKGASPLKVPLVPAFNTCFAPNRTHGPPLAFPSCNPPVATSTALTIGEPTVNGASANFTGSVKLKVKVGTPGPPDDSDLLIQGSLTDVRCATGTTPCGNVNTADGPDYTGGLGGSMIIRLSDRFNAVTAGGGNDAATMVDIPFPLNFTCANTASGTLGGQCSLNMSFNTLVPGAVRDGKRAVIEIGQVIIADGGTDGDPNTAPNSEFLKQGIFVP